MFDVLHGAIGVVHSIDEKNYTVRVKLLEHDNYITKNLQILTPLSFGNKISCIPHVDTPVMVVFVGDHGFILGAWNSENNKANKSLGKLVVDFQKSKLEIIEDGNIHITAEHLQVDTETMVINADKHTINAELEVNGNAKVNGKFEADEVKEGDIILGTHKTSGVTSGNGTSGKPVA